MMERTFDGERLQRVIEHPEVFRHVALGDTSIDVRMHVENPENVCLMNEHGGLLFVKLDDAVYEAHTQFLPSCRGMEAVMATKEAVDWLFRQTPCERITTFVPDGNRGALALCRALRFVLAGPELLVTPQGHLVQLDRYNLTRSMWAQWRH